MPAATEHSALTRIGLATLISCLCGVLVAGLALPVVGAIGLGAKAASDDFLALPTDLDLTPLPTRSRVLAADGSPLATFYAQNRVPTDPELVPDVLKQAVIAIEDARFYEHEGIDVRGTIRAAISNLKSGQVMQGGSTLTQQYVKNILIQQAGNDEQALRAAREDTADRKMREARYALALEDKLTKDQILHGYLEIAYFGNGAYGIGAAARFYYRKPVNELTLTESATLAGLLANPSRYDPLSTDPDVRREVFNRRNTVLGRMLDEGFISQQTHERAVKAPLPRLTPKKATRGCDAPNVSAPFFCDYVLRELIYTEVGSALGDSSDERFERLFRGGLTIRTTLDPEIQRAAQDAIRDLLPRTDPSGAATAVNVVEPGTGLIKAMAVNRTFGSTKKGQTKLNLATGGVFGYQPGSTFKPFTLAAALSQGIPVSTSIYSPSPYTSDVFMDGQEQYEVSNAGSVSGTFNLRTGTYNSVNTFFIQLAERVGLDAIYSLAESLGVKQRTGILTEKPLNRNSAAGVLGAFTVSPLAMAGAFAAFPAHGKFCPPRAVLSITAPSGELPVPRNECRQVLKPGVANTVVDILQDVIAKGTAARNGPIGRPAAGKTGTTNDSRAAWFIGFVPRLVAAVWVGLPNAAGEPQPMENVTIGGQYYGRMYGGALPARIWHDTMVAALQDRPVAQFSGASPEVVDGRELRVPKVSGLSFDEAVRRLTVAGLAPTRGRRVPSPLPEGVVAYTYPAAGSQAAKSTTTYVYTSTGNTQSAPAQDVEQAAPGNDQNKGKGRNKGNKGNDRNDERDDD